MNALRDLTIILDGKAIAGEVLESTAEQLSQAIRDSGCGCVAVYSSRVDVQLVAFVASETAGCDLLMMRDEGAFQSLAADLSIAGVIDDRCQLNLLPGQAAGRSGTGHVLLTTSGTTGRPKVARHSRAKLRDRIRAPKGESNIRWLLTFHPATFAGLQVVQSALMSGGTLVASSDTSPARMVEMVIAQRPTHVSATPTWLRAALMAGGERLAGIPVERITIGGEAVDQPLLDTLAATFPQAVIVHIYASTEAGSLFSVKDGRDGFPRAWLESGIDGVGLRIVDGMLEVKSPRAMARYEIQADGSPLSDDGWLKTRDLVVEEGDRVRFAGRADQVINVGGNKVQPEWVESVLANVPGVADIAVFAKASPLMGHLVGVRVVLAEGYARSDVEQTLRQQAASRLQPYERPALISFVDSIGMSAGGKKERKLS